MKNLNGQAKGFSSVEDRFYSYVDSSGGDDACWPWQGLRFTHNGTGHGRFCLKADDGRNTSVGAHRHAYVLSLGPIPENYDVIHPRCRNKVCCNPAHLKAVTEREGIMHGAATSSINAKRHYCSHGHELSGANVYAKALLKKKKRQCRQCSNAYSRQKWLLNLVEERRKSALRSARRRAAVKASKQTVDSSSGLQHLWLQ